MGRTCVGCGSDLSVEAVVCPQCQQQNPAPEGSVPMLPLEPTPFKEEARANSPVYRRRWFWPAVTLVAFSLGIALGLVGAGTSAEDRRAIHDAQAQVASLRTVMTDAGSQLSSLKSTNASLKHQLFVVEQERDSLKKELDPIRRAEEAAAKEAAEKARANAAAKEAAQQKAADDAAKKAAEEAANTFSDGVYLVGEDIKPGTYRGVVDDDMGYWARLKATDGSLDSIIANALPQGPFVITIKSSDVAVELTGVTITRK